MTRTVADCESEIQDLKQALEEERKYTEGLQEECEEMTIRLERIHWHLRSGAIRDALDADDGDVFTAMLVEIDGHTYGLRPGAARIVREALRYRNALACIATVAATEHDYQELALRVLGETDHMKLIQWRNAAIDSAMAKDGA